MKSTLAVSAALLLAGAAYAQPSHAQTTPQQSEKAAPTQTTLQPRSAQSTGGKPGAQARLPQGSYRASCNDVRMDGQTLIAFCPRGDGTWRTSAIGPVGQCVGDIRNVSGALQCNKAGYGSSTPPAQTQPNRAQPKH